MLGLERSGGHAVNDFGAIGIKDHWSTATVATSSPRGPGSNRGVVILTSTQTGCAPSIKAASFMANKFSDTYLLLDSLNAKRDVHNWICFKSMSQV